MSSKDKNYFDVFSRLEGLMQEKGWSRYRLAKEAGLPQSTLTNLWRKSNTPTIVTLEDICRALGITIAEFFTLPGESAPALTAQQSQLLAVWDRLSKEQKSAFLLLMDGCTADKN